ncbi:MAG: hypothetical protein IT374_11180 [Polyangiaceae bacterium]|nr:hypothetical protein [Polyangiaceae bacterium]
MATASLALLGAVSEAKADQMDPALERLTKPVILTPATGNPVTYGSCTGLQSAPNVPTGRFPGNITAGGLSGVAQCRPDNIAFARLINQYAMAIAPNAMHTARTTGYGGFILSFELAMTSLDKDADYLKQGTRGATDPNSKKASIRNDEPASSLPVYSIKVKKGFPLGFEVGAQVGYVGSTNIVTGGADVRLALLEGFRKGSLGILPDIGVGSGVRTVTGTPQFQLTVASFDVQISKPFPVADSSIISPYVGFQKLWIFGDSGLIDGTPNTDPLGYCGYAGPNVPGNVDPKKSTYDGQPVCAGGSPLDFNNTFVFEKVRIQRQRLIIGLSYRYEVVFVGGQFMTDIKAPEDSGGAENKAKLQGVPKQSTLAFELGAYF